MGEWSRRLQDAVRTANQRAHDQERDEKAAAADAQRRQSMSEALFQSQALPAIDRALGEAGAVEVLRQGTRASLDLRVMSGNLRGTSVALRAFPEKHAVEVYLYHRDLGIQFVRMVRTGDEAYNAACEGLVRVLQAPSRPAA
ncbi:MAG: hypothetical protein ACO1SV_13000 [Fimbriimonas sp.]